MVFGAGKKEIETKDICRDMVGRWRDKWHVRSQSALSPYGSCEQGVGKDQDAD